MRARFEEGKAGPAFGGKLAGRKIVPIQDLASNPLGVRKLMKKQYDGAGGLVEVPVEVPYWFEPVANADTPMCEALRVAKGIVEDWIKEHPKSFPPIVINVTDGEATDGDPEPIADEIKKLHVNCKNVLLYNCHISSAGGEPVRWPSEEKELTDPHAKKLFRMSSVLPDQAVELAQRAGEPVKKGSRGFVFNADIVDLVKFLDIGTRPATERVLR
jgi:hypothetical protein